MAEQQQRFLDNLNGVPTLWGRIKEFFALKKDLPTKVSDLTNDSGYQIASDVTSAINDALPTKVSELTNDSGYQTGSQVESAITVKGYQTSSQVESAIMAKGYQTASDVSSAINTALTSAIKYKGSVATADLLPENPSNGDMYNIIADSIYGPAGTNVAWSEDENRWDAQGGSFIVAAMTATDVNDICTDPSATME